MNLKDKKEENVGSHITPPLSPSRPSYVTIKPAREMPKRGKGGTIENRIAMLHALGKMSSSIPLVFILLLVHIESVAIDLSWDM